jgi:hypothetical protein
MSQALFVAFNIFVSLALFAYGLATNSHIRSRAEKRPYSITYLLVKFVDVILELTLFRPIFAGVNKPQTIEKQASRETFLRSPHDLAGVQDMIDVRPSLSISIDFSRKLPEFYGKYFGNSGLLIISACYLALIIIMMVSQYTSGWLPTLLTLALSISVLFWFGNLVGSEGSLVSVLGKLYYWPYIIVNIDSKTVSVMGGWGRRVFENSSEFSFSVVEYGLTKGLCAGYTGTKKTATIFEYHQFLQPFVMTEEELLKLAQKLNTLLEKVRSMPAIRYDEV